MDAFEEMNLMARILSDEHSVSPLKDEMVLFDELQKNLESFHEVLTQSKHEQTDKLWQNMRRDAEALKLYLAYPEVLGKTLVGILPLNKESLSYFDGILPQETLQLLMMNQNVPSLLFSMTDGESGIRFLNTAWHQEKISSSEYIFLEKELWKKEIEINQLLFCYAFKLVSSYRANNQALVVLPRYQNWSLFIYSLLYSQFDAMVVLGEPRDISSKKLLERAMKKCETQGIPVTLLNSLGMGGDKAYVPEDALREYLAKWNIPRTVCRTTDRFKKNLCLYNAEMQRIKEEYDTALDAMTHDLTFIRQSKMQESIRKWKQEQKEKRGELVTEQRGVAEISTALIISAEKLQNAFLKHMDGAFKSQDIQEIADLVILYCQNGKFEEAEQLKQKLKRCGWSYTYILELLLQKETGQLLQEDLLSRLRHEKDTEFVCRAKLYFLDELGYGDEDAVKFIHYIKKTVLPIDIYYQGLAAEKQSSVDVAWERYQKAWEMGYDKASDGLMRLVKKDPEKLLPEAANAMVPEACYLLAMKMKEGKNHYYKADRYLKIAAAHGHYQAVRELTMDFYKRLKCGYYKNATEEELRKKAETCRSLGEFLLKRQPADGEILERQGFLCKLYLKDKVRARDYWEKAGTAEALYQCGRLYQYPKAEEGDLGQDLDKAEDFFEKAAEKGHEKAERELSKVRNWKNNKLKLQQRPTTYRETTDYSSKIVETEKESSGGCFITTAVCTSLNKGDDCEELMAMRAFRDVAVKENPLLRILIGEYYRVAPLIIEEIDQQEKAGEIYRKIWQQYVKQSLYFLKQGKKTEAAVVYIRMCEHLAARYQVELSPASIQAIKEFCHSHL